MFTQPIVQQITMMYLETLQFKYQHAWTYILPSISAMIRLFGPQFPYLFNELLQQLLAIYDSSVKGDAAYVFQLMNLNTTTNNNILLTSSLHSLLDSK